MSEQLLKEGASSCGDASGAGLNTAIANTIASAMEGESITPMLANIAAGVFVGLAVGALGALVVLKSSNGDAKAEAKDVKKPAKKEVFLSHTFKRKVATDYDIAVSKLMIYPIKSCAGVALTSAEITRTGLKNDRLFMIVDSTYRFVSQRKCPSMALICPEITDEGKLKISLKDGGTYEHTPVFSGTRHKVTVWDSECEAFDQGDEVAQFLADFMKMEGVRLVRMTEDWFREVGETGDAAKGYVAPNVFQTSFSDAYPFLLASESSLKDISEKLGKELSMLRFRPNIIVKGNLPAWNEDYWEELRIGNDLVFKIAKLCNRCKVPTVDPETGKFDSKNQPTVALREHRSIDKQVMFGQNLVCLHGEGFRISVDDPVKVLGVLDQLRY